MTTTQQATPDTDVASAVLPDELHEGAIEAMLLTSDRALSAGKIAQALGLEGDAKKTIDETIDRLNGRYEQGGHAVRIERVAGGFRVMTLPQYAPALIALHGVRESGRLTKAAIETLAIVAYRQPVTRAQVEGIRGVSSGEVLRSLLERKLVAVVGRAEELGRPMLYGTTRRFLESFGLSSVKDLPAVGDLLPPDIETPISTPAEPQPAPDESQPGD